MKKMIRFLKLLSDPLRLRILALLLEKELCVCQIMVITGASQPLISRNLSLLSQAGLLSERRDGKLMFYRINTDIDIRLKEILFRVCDAVKDDPVFKKDRTRVVECEEFQKRLGRCDMKALREYMKKRVSG